MQDETKNCPAVSEGQTVPNLSEWIAEREANNEPYSVIVNVGVTEEGAIVPFCKRVFVDCPPPNANENEENALMRAPILITQEDTVLTGNLYGGRR